MSRDLVRSAYSGPRLLYQTRRLSHCSTHRHSWTKDSTYHKINPPNKDARKWTMPELPLNIIQPHYSPAGGISPWDDIIPLAYPIGPPEWYDKHLAEGMRNAGRRAAECLAYAASLVKPGITTRAIDTKIFDWAVRHGFYPSSLNYGRFPGSLCTSVNNVISHGVPNEYSTSAAWLMTVNHFWRVV
jgi:methionyl aminopeptidase